MRGSLIGSRRRPGRTAAFLAALLSGAMTSPALAEKPPSAAQALALKPVQRDVDYDTPDKKDVEKCTVEPEADRKGWVVRDPQNQLLRRFVDSNGDNHVDQWCYFKNGIEVYRDIDANFNRKADQYRWLGTQGSRWGTDKDEDGRVDAWKSISAEEVTAEVVLALRDQDEERFRRVLLSPTELEALKLGTSHQEELAKKCKAASTGFGALANKQKIVSHDSRWVHFAGGIPGMMAAGTDGSQTDLLVYDNVAAVAENAGKHAQVVIGTLVRVENGWRVIDLPSNLLENQVAAAPEGYFFQSVYSERASDEDAPAGLAPEIQKLIAELERVDKELTDASEPQRQAKLNEQRAEVLDRLVASAKNDEERDTWVRQFADTVSAAVQSGGYPNGIDRLKTLFEKTAADKLPSETQAYVKYRWLTADYGRQMQDPDAKHETIQEQWLKDLEAFVGDFPKCPDAADAMSQLAVAQEFAGEDEKALEWYARIVKDFETHDLAKKAAGAKHRLQLVGRPLTLRGATSTGATLDIAALKGSVVVVHYWATWCEPCKQDMEALRQLQAKYAKQKFSIVGVNLDRDTQDFQKHMQAHRVPWPQLHEEGGLDGRLATELGIVTLPTMFLVDTDGKVLNRNLHATELDAELKRLLKVK